MGLEDVYNKVQIKLLMDLLAQYEALLPENLGRDCREWLIGKRHSEINLNSHSRKEPTARPHNVHRRPARVGHTLLSKGEITIHEDSTYLGTYLGNHS